MKNFVKLFLAVAALFAVSCTTDATEDLGVQLGEEQTVITLSLESSRTQLGEKVGESYPFYWSEDDKISVNGVESNAAIIDNANKTSAKFVFNTKLTTPYCVAYPAAPVGQVLFADKQVHAGNTSFASGVSTMYGYSADGLELQIKHLTGVLKIGIVGSAKLTMAQISNANRAPIAGAFNLDFAEGEYTASASAKEFIEYSFGDGVQLSNEPTYIHVVVPAGTYDKLYVTLYDIDGGVMYATIKTDETRPLVAGNVREFLTNIDYAANDQVFVVKDVASLKAFAEAAPTLDKDVVFVADVDMTGEAWTSIEGYTKTVHGNGYAIKGLTAPLFGTTSASIRALHLRDVVINETVNPQVGALARMITATADVQPMVVNCSINGSITVNTPNKVHIEGESESSPYAIGGLIGNAIGVLISDCTSDVDLTVYAVTSAANTVALRPCIGGMLGIISNYTQYDTDGTTVLSDIASHVYNLESKGSVHLSNYDYTADYGNAVYNPISPYVGGLLGLSSTTNETCEINNLTNRADVTIEGNWGDATYVGGVVGIAMSKKCEHLYNYGDLSYTKGNCRYLRIGGVVSLFYKTSESGNLHNYGTVSTSSDTLILSCVAGGVLGYQGSSETSIASGSGITRNSSNNGPINLSHKMIENADAYYYYRVGGISGWTQHKVSSCTNGEKGKITIRGTLFNADDSNYSICVAGVVGYKTVNDVYDSENNAELDIDITCKTTATSYSAVRFNCGGIIGYSNFPVKRCVNNGDINIAGTYNCQLRLGGIGGHTNTQNSTFPSCNTLTNNGNITIKSGSTFATTFYVAGGFGCTTVCTDLTNTGTITIEKDAVVGSSKSSTLIGGCVASLLNNGTNIKNSGNIHIKGAKFNNSTTVSKGPETFSIILGGAISYATDAVKKLDNIENRGSITVDATTIDYAHYGGVLGWSFENSSAVSAAVSNLHNYGPITISGTASNRLYVGGVASYFGGTTQNVHNHDTGTITVNATVKGNISAGGVSYICKDTLVGAINDADITINGAIGGTLYGSGGIVNGNNYSRTDLVNNGDFIVNSKVGTNCFVGGLTYDSGYSLRYINCQNNGNLILGEDAVISKQNRWGGFIGKLESAKVNIFNGCSNTGDIIIKGTVKDMERYGGLIGCHTKGTICILNGFVNSGDIIVSSTHTNTDSDSESDKTVAIGGVFGSCGSTALFTNTSYPAWSGEIINTGTLKFDGTSNSPVRIGGIFGRNSAAVGMPAGEHTFINVGDLVLQGKYVDHDRTAVGGIIGATTLPIDGATSYTTITVHGTQNYGLILGDARSATVVASNCKVGGKILSKSTAEDTKYNETVISQDNYFNFIYSGGANTDWTGTENYDGCTFLSAAPSLTPTTPAE